MDVDVVGFVFSLVAGWIGVVGSCVIVFLIWTTGTLLFLLSFNVVDIGSPPPKSLAYVNV